ncbi:hypothetical protein, partial [Acinetobacter bereziniae]
MNFQQLNEIAKADEHALKASKKIKEDHARFSNIFSINAQKVVDTTDYILCDLLNSVAPSNGLIPINFREHVWGTSNQKIIISFRVKENATLSKAQTVSQIVVKRGRLENIFNTVVKHKNSKHLENAKLYRDFSNNLRSVCIQDMFILQNQIEKMHEYQEFMNQNFN